MSIDSFQFSHEMPEEIVNGGGGAVRYGIMSKQHVLLLIKQAISLAGIYGQQTGPTDVQTHNRNFNYSSRSLFFRASWWGCHRGSLHIFFPVSLLPLQLSSLFHYWVLLLHIEEARTPGVVT
jgi:hypothetical protein